MLLYTGIQRNAHEVVDEQIERTKSGDNSKELGGLKALVNRGIEVLTGGGELSEFGALLHEGWMLKRGLSSKISTSWIDEVYERGRRAGVVGGKLLGAGGGGRGAAGSCCSTWSPAIVPRFGGPCPNCGRPSFLSRTPAAPSSSTGRDANTQRGPTYTSLAGGPAIAPRFRYCNRTKSGDPCGLRSSHDAVMTLLLGTR